LTVLTYDILTHSHAPTQFKGHFPGKPRLTGSWFWSLIPNLQSSLSGSLLWDRQKLFIPTGYFWL